MAGNGDWIRLTPSAEVRPVQACDAFIGFVLRQTDPTTAAVSETFHCPVPKQHKQVLLALARAALAGNAVIPAG